MRITFRYQNFIKVPEKEKLEETAFCLAAEWMNPCDLIISSKIKLELQDLQSKVRIVLEQQYPSHQLLKMDKEVVNLWKRKNLSDNQFTINETRQILDCILQVMNSGGKESCSTATLSSASGSRVFDEPNLFILTEVRIPNIFFFINCYQNNNCIIEFFFSSRHCNTNIKPVVKRY